MSERQLFGVLVKTVYIPGFLMFVGHGMIAPVVPLYAISLGGTLTAAGAVVALRGLGQLLFNLPSGMLISRLGTRKLLYISAAGAALVACATGLTRSIPILGLFTFLAGGLQSMWQMTRVSYVRSSVPPAMRGRAISAIGGALRIGGFVGPIIGGFVAKRFGFASTFFAQGLISALTLGIHLLPVRGVAASEKPNVPESNTLSDIGVVLSKHAKSFLTVGLVTLGFGLVRSVRQTIFPLWGDSISLDVAAIGLIVGFSSALDMLLFLPAGQVMDRKGRKWTAVPSLTIMSLALFALPLSNTFAGLLGVGLAIGFGNGLGSGIVMTLGADLAPDDKTGTFLGLWFLASGIGGTLGPLIVGALADALSLGASSLAIGSMGLATAFYLLFFVGETHPDKRT